MFIFKKPTITLDCVVPDEFAFCVDYSPVQKAGNFLPQWFKDIRPPTGEKFKDLDPVLWESKRNVRHCPGIGELLNKGFIMPMWCDVIISVNKNGYSYQFSDGMSSLSLHSNDQIAGFADDYVFLKIESPWLISASRALSCGVFPLTYHHGYNLEYKQVPGILPTISKKNIMHSQTFVVVDGKRDSKILISCNQPLTHYVPLVDDYKLEIKCVADSKYHKKLQSLVRTPVGFFGTFYKKRTIDKCPFSRSK